MEFANPLSDSHILVWDVPKRKVAVAGLFLCVYYACLILLYLFFTNFAVLF